jgi:WD40 repeat protein/class 3 adenylate cyclase
VAGSGQGTSSEESAEQMSTDTPRGTFITEATPAALTFLIADVRGYTRFTRERGDAAAAILATKFAELAREATEARGGRVLELRGDEVLAVFRSPAQAVRAAVEFLATCEEESQEDPAFELPVGIGIDVGEAVPVEQGYRGVALNLAARLCSGAGAGQVLVTRSVRDQAQLMDDVVFVDRGLANFKGFEEPVPVVEAMPAAAPSRGGVAQPTERREVSPAEGFPPELDPLTPLVDRDREKHWLRGTWRQARRGRGRLLVVSGPAQIGKTRLAAEIAAHVLERGGTITYAGPGGAATALALSAVREIASVAAPTLLVLDDLDVAGPAVAEALAEAEGAIAAAPILVLGLVREASASPLLAKLVEGADGAGDAHRVLAPMDLDGVRGIVRLYVGEDVREAPIESMARSSGGVPGRVHEVVSDWARSEAGRRLEAAAEWLAAGRDRRSADLEFANNVIGLKLDRLYAVEQRDIAPERVGEVCPYKGLAAFDETDAAYFFGRERLVGELAARTVQTGLLSIVGASGSGKSSAISAGLLPSLSVGLLPGSERWQHAVMRPGEHPLAELRTILEPLAPQEPAGRDPIEAAPLASEARGSRLVLVVDQFEEVFTTCADEVERSRFIDAVSSVARSPESAVVVLAIRGDYYGHCAAHPELAELLAANHVLVGPMTPEELRRAIELPARRTGLRVESALTDALVEEVAEEPGGLPLLSTALVELWQARESGWLRMEAHERTDGVRGAVARLAESAYERLTVEEREVAKRVFLRLAAAADGESTARRRVRLEEFDLEHDPVVAAVISRLAQDRLLTVSEGTVEVAHEALLREWPRLRAWLEEDVQGRRLHLHITETAREWEEGGRDPADLYRGARLASALDWTGEHSPEVNRLEASFLGESRDVSEREVVRARRTNRRLRGLLAGVALFLAVALVAGSIAVAQRRSAQLSVIAADARRLAAESLLEPRLDRALLMALEAVHLDDTAQARSALFTALLRSPAAISQLHLPAGETPTGAALSADGQTLAIASVNLDTTLGHLFLYDASTLRELGLPILLGPGGMSPPVFSPNGSMIAIAGGGQIGQIFPPGYLELINVTTRSIVLRKTFPKYHVAARSVAFSPDGRTVALQLLLPLPAGPRYGTYNLSAILYDTHTGDQVARFPLKTQTDEAGASGLAFLPNGRFVVSAQSLTSTTTELWDLSPVRLVRTFDRGGYVTISPDGTTIAVGEVQEGIRSSARIFLVDLRTGRSSLLQSGHLGTAGGLVFTPDGRTLLSSDSDQMLVWNLATRSVQETFSGHTGPIASIALDPTGSTAYTVGGDGVVLVWDLTGDRRIIATPFRFAQSPFSKDGYPGVAVNPTGTLLATSYSNKGTIMLWHPPSMTRAGALPGVHGGPTNGIAFSPDGKTLVSTGDDGTVAFWDLSTMSMIGKLIQATKGIGWTAAFSADGTRLVTSGDDGPQGPDNTLLTASVIVWNAATRKPIRTFHLHGSTCSPAISGDGNVVSAATGPLPSQAAVWDVVTGRTLVSPEVGPGVCSSDLSPDGRTFALSNEDGTVQFWNVRTGRRMGAPLSVTTGNTFIWSVRFSPDGTQLATSSQGAALWNLATGTRIGPALGATDSAGPVLFSPDGKSLIDVRLDGTGTIWNVDSASWAVKACLIAGRNLTPAEWRDLLPDRPYTQVCPG